MTQAADTEDGYFAAGADVGADEWGVGRYAGAQEGCGFVGGEGVWDLEDVVLVCSDVVGPATVCFASVFVRGVVCVWSTSVSPDSDLEV